MSDGALLAIDGLRVALGRSMAPVLDGIALRVLPGEVHGLVGESGAGKTMLGRAILGLLPSTARIEAGGIRFDGRDLTTLAKASRRAILGREIALVPQDPLTALNPARRVGVQLEDALSRRVAPGACRARARALLAEVRLGDPDRVLASYPHELSGGMRQRVLIAMAFGVEPRLVIADEPTTALDVTVQRSILRLMRDMQRRHATAILFITHDLGVVAQLCDRMTVLQHGRVVETGPVADVLAAPRALYTRALLAATPRLDLQPEPGRVG